MTIKNFVRSITPSFLWEYLRSLRIRRGIGRFTRQVAVHSFCGQTLKVLIADVVGQGWYDQDWARLNEVELLAQGRLRSGAIVFDLGAHQGVVAMVMAKIVGESGRIIAVEGMKHNCDVAIENLILNSIENVIVRHAVVSDTQGQIRFFEGLNGSVACVGAGKMVDAVTIDSLAACYGDPDVVFIDIEGFEEKALKGASETLKKATDWFIEVHVDCGLETYGGSVQRVLDHFATENYERYIWNLDCDQKPQGFTSNSPVLKRRFALVAIHR
jgi:FkbM family methyltransferase